MYGSTRRAFLAATAVVPALRAGGRGQTFPPDWKRYADPATEFEVLRLTDPAYSTRLPSCYGRSVSRKSNSLLVASERDGTMQAYRLDWKTGVSRQLTEAKELQPSTLTLLGDERGFCYIDGRALTVSYFSGLRDRVVYEVEAGWENAGEFSVAEDGLYGVLVERNEGKSRLRLISMVKGTAVTVAESDGAITAPVTRPKRASVLYHLNDALWLVHYDGQQNRILKTAEGAAGPAMWSPDGRTVLYLNYPAEKGKLNTLRELTPDTAADKPIAPTSQFVQCNRNSDASVFVGASASKASPYVLLLIRAVRREMTLCEHKASDPSMVMPAFAPSSQRIFFQSDRHGKMAIYSMAVDKLVEKTES